MGCNVESVPVLAVDPGREKCGVALLAPDGAVLIQRVVPTGQLADMIGALAAEHEPTVIMGNGTTSAAAKERVEMLGCSVLLVDEYRTTDAAKEAYWTANPPRGWRRRPSSAPAAANDFVAVILAQRFLAKQNA